MKVLESLLQEFTQIGFENFYSSVIVIKVHVCLVQTILII